MMQLKKYLMIKYLPAEQLQLHDANGKEFLVISEYNRQVNVIYHLPLKINLFLRYFKFLLWWHLRAFLWQTALKRENTLQLTI